MDPATRAPRVRIRDLVRIAFEHVGLNPDGYVVEDPEFMRPAEVDELVADSSKARTELGWTPRGLDEGLPPTLALFTG